jgi:hypothetical protein
VRVVPSLHKTNPTIPTAPATRPLTRTLPTPPVYAGECVVDDANFVTNVGIAVIDSTTFGVGLGYGVILLVTGALSVFVYHFVCVFCTFVRVLVRVFVRICVCVCVSVRVRMYTLVMVCTLHGDSVDDAAGMMVMV